MPDGGSDHIRVLGPRFGIDLRLDQSRPDRIDAYTVLAELGGESSREAQDAMFRRRVCGGVRPIHMHEGLDGTDVDDPPFGRPELVQEGMCDIEHAVQIDRQDIVPVLRHRHWIAGDVITPIDSGVVDKDGDFSVSAIFAATCLHAVRLATSSSIGVAMPPALTIRSAVSFAPSMLTSSTRRRAPSLA